MPDWDATKLTRFGIVYGEQTPISFTKAIQIYPASKKIRLRSSQGQPDRSGPHSLASTQRIQKQGRGSQNNNPVLIPPLNAGSVPQDQAIQVVNQELESLPLPKPPRVHVSRERSWAAENSRRIPLAMQPLRQLASQELLRDNFGSIILARNGFLVMAYTFDEGEL
ncbi:hypothetical protein QYF36_001343 [Acer negundo]|nr:hypothetical protein QYF36_001343 [Acer negundo]